MPMYRTETVLTVLKIIKLIKMSKNGQILWKHFISMSTYLCNYPWYLSTFIWTKLAPQSCKEPNRFFGWTEKNVPDLSTSEVRAERTRIARWNIFIPKIPIWAYFEGPWNGKFL
jgi:hypothetical protein